MKLNRLETHDRYEYFTKQSFSIAECCQDLINKRPYGIYPFYIFAHTRTADDGVTKRLIWQPRLTKPRAQSNSMLFKAYPGTDILKVIWIIPDKTLWAQFKKNNITNNQTVIQSINDYQNNKTKLEQPEDDDLSESQIDAIYKEISRGANLEKRTFIKSTQAI
jgi:hypothetical protein